MVTTDELNEDSEVPVKTRTRTRMFSRIVILDPAGRADQDTVRALETAVNAFLATLDGAEVPPTVTDMMAVIQGGRGLAYKTCVTYTTPV